MKFRFPDIRVPPMIFLTCLAWMVTLIGYFGPWVKHPSAALAWNAYDLFEFLQMLPPIEAGTLNINLHALHMPLIGLGLVLPLQLCFKHSPIWVYAILGILSATLCIATLPPYPKILGAWRSLGWARLSFWWGSMGIVGVGLALWASPRLRSYRPWITLASTTLMSIPAIATFHRLIPALSDLHATSIQPGWGFWSYVLGLFCISLLLWFQGLRKETQLCLNNKT